MKVFNFTRKFKLFCIEKGKHNTSHSSTKCSWIYLELPKTNKCLRCRYRSHTYIRYIYIRDKFLQLNKKYLCNAGTYKKFPMVKWIGKCLHFIILEDIFLFWCVNLHYVMINESVLTSKKYTSMCQNWFMNQHNYIGYVIRLTTKKFIFYKFNYNNN